MEMMTIMFSPILALGLFMVYPFWTALQVYVPIFLFGALVNIKMMTSMKLPVKTGMEGMIGEEALVVEDIYPEGKVRINGEIWTATTKGKAFPKGKTVRIAEVRGLILILEDQARRSETSPGYLSGKQPREMSPLGY